LTRVKRPDRLAEMAIDVGRTHPDATFVVAGEGDLLDELRGAMAPLGDRARFLGWCRDMEAVHAACDVEVLTSDNEGMPLSLIEAGLCGVPVVTTRVGSAAEVVADGSTGFVVDRDAAAVAAAVRRLLDDGELRRRMREAAARFTQ